MAVSDDNARQPPLRTWGVPPREPLPTMPTHESVLHRHVRQPAMPAVAPVSAPLPGAPERLAGTHHEPAVDILTDNDDMVIVKIPKATLTRIVQESLMNQKIETANTAAATNAAAPTTERLANANPAAPENGGVQAAPVAAVVAVPAAAPGRWRKALSIAGTALGGVAVGVGGTLLAQRYGLKIGGKSE